MSKITVDVNRVRVVTLNTGLRGLAGSDTASAEGFKNDAALSAIQADEAKDAMDVKMNIFDTIFLGYGDTLPGTGGTNGVRFYYTGTAYPIGDYVWDTFRMSTVTVSNWNIFSGEGERGDQGITGDAGTSHKADATGTLLERDAYDSQPKGFGFLATNTGHTAGTTFSTVSGQTSYKFISEYSTGFYYFFASNLGGDHEVWLNAQFGDINRFPAVSGEMTITIDNGNAANVFVGLWFPTTDLANSASDAASADTFSISSPARGGSTAEPALPASADLYIRHSDTVGTWGPALKLEKGDTGATGSAGISGRKNYIINGNFDIWQRGTAFTEASGNYAADRWRYAVGTGIFEQRLFTRGQTDVPGNPRYFMDFEVTSAATFRGFQQRIEDVYTLAGETATISFYAKSANPPAELRVNFFQDFGDSGSTDITVLGDTITGIVAGWTKYTVTIDVPSVSGKAIGDNSSLYLDFHNPNNELWQVEIAQVQVERGSQATEFERRFVADELALCQRYYYRSGWNWYKVMNDTAPFAALGTNDCAISIDFPTVMRVTPTFSIQQGVFQYALATGAVVNATLSGNKNAMQVASIQGSGPVSLLISGQFNADAEL